MITFKENSILNATEKIIAVHTNIDGRYSSKICKDIRNKYPNVFNEYFKLFQEYKSNNKSLLGKCQLVEIDKNKYIANLFSQKYYSKDTKFTNYNAFIKAFVSLLRKADGDIALPDHIACSANGSNWNKLFNMIELLSKEFKYNITIYKYK